MERGLGARVPPCAKVFAVSTVEIALGSRVVGNSQGVQKTITAQQFGQVAPVVAPRAGLRGSRWGGHGVYFNRIWSGLKIEDCRLKMKDRWGF